MRCSCVEASLGFLAGLAASALAWQVVTPVSWAEGLAATTAFTLALTVSGGLLGRRQKQRFGHREFHPENQPK